MNHRTFGILTVLVGVATVVTVIVFLRLASINLNSNLGAIVVAVAAALATAIWMALFSVYRETRPPKRVRIASVDESIKVHKGTLATVPDYLKGLVRESGRTAAGPIIEVCPHPRLALREGWTLDQVKYYPQGKVDWIPNNLVTVYREFKDANLGPPERLETDLSKVMLVKPPSTEAKFDTFPLYWTTGLYSEMRFFQARYGEPNVHASPPASVTKFRLQPEQDRQRELVGLCQQALRGKLAYPASVSINCFVVTADEQLLVYRRGHSITYFPGKWVLTLDENVIYDEDFAKPSKKDFIWNCIVRGLKLELVGERVPIGDVLDRDRVRLLTFFIEGNLPGVGICAFVPLKVNSKQLESLLSERPDWEDTSEPRCVPISELRWDKLQNQQEFDSGWGWKTQFLLLTLKRYLGGDQLDALAG